jgi:hypothetical protein
MHRSKRRAWGLVHSITSSARAMNVGVSSTDGGGLKHRRSLLVVSQRLLAQHAAVGIEQRGVTPRITPFF